MTYLFEYRCHAGFSQRVPCGPSQTVSHLPTRALSRSNSKLAKKSSKTSRRHPSSSTHHVVFARGGLFDIHDRVLWSFFVSAATFVSLCFLYDAPNTTHNNRGRTFSHRWVRTLWETVSQSVILGFIPRHRPSVEGMHLAGYSLWPLVDSCFYDNVSFCVVFLKSGLRPCRPAIKSVFLRLPFSSVVVLVASLTSLVSPLLACRCCLSF